MIKGHAPDALDALQRRCSVDFMTGKYRRLNNSHKIPKIFSCSETPSITF